LNKTTTPNKINKFATLFILSPLICRKITIVYIINDGFILIQKLTKEANCENAEKNNFIENNIFILYNLFKSK